MKRLQLVGMRWMMLEMATGGLAKISRRMTTENEDYGNEELDGNVVKGGREMQE